MQVRKRNFIAHHGVITRKPARRQHDTLRCAYGETLAIAFHTDPENRATFVLEKSDCIGVAPKRHTHVQSRSQQSPRQGVAKCKPGDASIPSQSIQKIATEKRPRMSQGEGGST